LQEEVEVVGGPDAGVVDHDAGLEVLVAVDGLPVM
jgi:hypothetical protein